MKDPVQLSVYLGFATLVIVVAIAFLMMWRDARAKRTDTDVILDAIDDVRIAIDSDVTNSVFEHEALGKKLDDANGRLIFLMSKDIAEEIEAIKAAAAAPKDDDKGPPT